MSRDWMPTKPNFGPPPANYVAGLGRGASGFITRGDAGPLRVPEGKVVAVSAAEVQEAGYDDAKYDQWDGFGDAPFVKEQIDEEDKQAELAYDFCEKKIQERRKIKEVVAEVKPLNANFVDLKRELVKVTYEEWQNLPQSFDSGIKKRKKQTFTPVPDSLIAGLVAKSQVGTVAEGQGYRQAKDILFRSELDRAQGTVGGRQSVNVAGYLTQLTSSKLNNEFIGDAKKARLLLQSAILANPRNPDLWISAARVEQLEGKTQQAREVLRKAVDQCPKSEDLWIELSRVERQDQAKNVLIQGLRHLPNSPKIWLYAANLEQDREMRSKILRKGLENNSQSVRLWRELIEMEDMGQAKQLLGKAVQCLPQEVDLWLALAKLQEYDMAKKVLNRARKANPMSLEVWIGAARLQQTQLGGTTSTLKKVEDLLSKARDILAKNGNTVSREEWLQEALAAEKSDCLVTCEAIVRVSVALGLTSEQIKNAVAKDTLSFQNQRNSIHTVRWLYESGIRVTKDRRLLQSFISFEKRLKKKQQQHKLGEALHLGVQMFPTQYQFWLNNIEKLIEQAEWDAALQCIQAAASNIEGAKKQLILLQKARICVLKGHLEEAKEMLKVLREAYPDGRSIFESIKLECRMQDYNAAWQLCDEYFKRSQCEQLWLLASKIKNKMGQMPQAIALAQKALLRYSQSQRLWIQIITIVSASGQTAKARSLIDRALLRLPRSLQLNIISVDFEREHGQAKDYSSCLAKALKLFPTQGELWSRSIEGENKATRKKKASAAVEACENNALIQVAVGLTFWKEGKQDKARRWLEEAVKADSNNGDVWAAYLRFLQLCSQKDYLLNQQHFLSKVNSVTGREWTAEVNAQNYPRPKEQILKAVTLKIDKRLKNID